jgi:hypothetical protein
MMLPEYAFEVMNTRFAPGGGPTIPPVPLVLLLLLLALEL